MQHTCESDQAEYDRGHWFFEQISHKIIGIKALLKLAGHIGLVIRFMIRIHEMISGNVLKRVLRKNVDYLNYENGKRKHAGGGSAVAQQPLQGPGSRERGLPVPSMAILVFLAASTKARSVAA